MYVVTPWEILTPGWGTTAVVNLRFNISIITVVEHECIKEEKALKDVLYGKNI